MTPRGEDHVTKEAETGVIKPQVKECVEPQDLKLAKRESPSAFVQP